jgi:hypothetical protein
LEYQLVGWMVGGKRAKVLFFTGRDNSEWIYGLGMLFADDGLQAVVHAYRSDTVLYRGTVSHRGDLLIGFVALEGDVPSFELEMGTKCAARAPPAHAPLGGEGAGVRRPVYKREKYAASPTGNMKDRDLFQLAFKKYQAHGGVRKTAADPEPGA